MQKLDRIYIDGNWVTPTGGQMIDVINPASEEACAQLLLGSSSDVDKAVTAARKAFRSFSRTSREERLELLGKVIAGYKARMGDLAQAITTEMGAPKWLAASGHAGSGLGHLMTAAKTWRHMNSQNSAAAHISKKSLLAFAVLSRRGIGP